MTGNLEFIELINLIKSVISLLMPIIGIIAILKIIIYAYNININRTTNRTTNDCQHTKKLNRKWLKFNLEKIVKKYYLNERTTTNIRQVIEAIDQYSNILTSKQIKYIALEKTEQINKVNILKQEFANNLKEMIIENYNQDVIQKYCQQTYYMIDDMEREFKKLVKAKQETRLSDKIQITNDLIN